MNIINYIFNKKNSHYYNNNHYLLFKKMIKEINLMEKEFRLIKTQDIKKMHVYIKHKIKSGLSSTDILIEACALFREVCKRIKRIRCYDTQILCSLSLCFNKVVEMPTGEGKTLSILLASYIYYLWGKHVHIVTVNDYLTSRDSLFSREIMNFFEISIGKIIQKSKKIDKLIGYRTNIVYLTHNQLVFDYLNNKAAKNTKEQLPIIFECCIVDEIDTILIDDSKIPIILSKFLKKDKFFFAKNIIKKITSNMVLNRKKGDFYLLKKEKIALLTNRGYKTIEYFLKKNALIKNERELYNFPTIQFINQIKVYLAAKYLYIENIDYVIQYNEYNQKTIVIIDQNTGRLMPGRRWSNGLHQALEAKEGLIIEKDLGEKVSTTFQNFFLRYKYLVGLSGTIITDSYELKKVYKKDTILIPTNRKKKTINHTPILLKKREYKYKRILKILLEKKKTSQPILIITSSIKEQKYLSSYLTINNIQHAVLSVFNINEEKTMIENIALPKKITIATNLVGRGTDIILGGKISTSIKLNNMKLLRFLKKKWINKNKNVIKAGGLFAIITEKHISQRVNNQFIGRVGRQGDPGENQFFISLEDTLFIGHPIRKLKKEVIDNLQINKKIIDIFVKNIQLRNEYINFQNRKTSIQYGRIIEKQKKLFWKFREKILKSDNIYLLGINIIKHTFQKLMLKYNKKINIFIKISSYILGIEFKNIEKKNYYKHVINYIRDKYIKFIQNRDERKIVFNRYLMLFTLDTIWEKYALSIESIKNYAYLHIFIKKDPYDIYIQKIHTFFAKIKNQFLIKLSSFFCKYNFIH